ncbi:MAG: tetratricopeptide repeat protein [Bacteroidia bacterium]|nr:tetratricopeptide repeat protein [Bacteroidia bacterium]
MLDSLKLALKNATHDTTRCNILSELAETAPDGEWEKYNEQLKQLAEKNIASASGTAQKNFYLTHLAASLNNIGFIKDAAGDFKGALEYYNNCLKILEKINLPNGQAADKAGIADAFYNIGGLYLSQGKLAEATEYYFKSLKLKKELGDEKGTSGLLNNIAVIFLEQGDIAKALDFNSQSLQIKEKIRDEDGIAYSLNNIGLIYARQGDLSKALEYYNKSLEIRKKTGDKGGVANCLLNIGFVYSNRSDFTNAQNYYSKCLQINKEMGDNHGIADALNNLGYVNEKKGNTIKAIECYSESLTIREKIADNIGVAASLNNLGGVYLNKNKISKALECCNKALSLSTQMGFPEHIRNAANHLAVIYKKQNNFKSALTMFELYVTMRDSISNQETKKASVKTQLKYEYEKKSAADSVKNAEAKKVKDAQLQAQSASLKQEKTQRYALYGGLVLVAGFLIFVINRFRITNKQKKIIEEQKIVVDDAFEKLYEKNKEVLDSIYYARRIQRALITSEKYIERVLLKLNN